MPVDQGSKSLSVPHSSRRKSAADTTIAETKRAISVHSRAKLIAVLHTYLF